MREQTRVAAHNAANTVLGPPTMPSQA